MIKIFSQNTGTASATYNVHTLNKAFSETAATWNSNATGFNSAVAASITNVTNDPQWKNWSLTSTIQSWVNGASTNYGVMVKHANEASTTQLERILTTSSELTSAPQLRPKLEITYVDKKAANSYYAPKSPTKMHVGTTYDVDVTLTNATTSTWTGTTDKLSYHWSLPDGTDKTDVSNQLTTLFKPLDANGNEATTPVNVAPGQTITVRAKVKAPNLHQAGAIREGFFLKWDLNLNGTWLSERAADPIPTLNQYISVEDPNGGKELGIEDSHTTIGDEAGADSGIGLNLFRGNAVFTYDAFVNPSKGDLDTTVDLTYNSLDTSESPLGQGWSLSISSLMRVGSPMDNMVKVDQQGNIVSGSMILTDEDGTSHLFTYDATKKEFVGPPGTDMYLQYLNGGIKTKKWVITEPDRTQYFFDEQGYITEEVDNTGNSLKYIYEDINANNMPFRMLRYIQDSSGRKTLTIDYQSDGKIKQIKDVGQGTDQRILDFTYGTEGHLTQFTDGYGKAEAKTYKFYYDLLFKSIINRIVDPLGKETKYTYYVSGSNQMKVNTITNRKSETVTYTYNGSEKIATDIKGNQTKYVMDSNGNPTSITDAKGNVTNLTYDANQNLIKQVEPNGATTTWTYDNNGLILSETDPENNKISEESLRKSTKYEYQYLLNGHVAELKKETTPSGRSTAYTYDVQGNISTITDDLGNQTSHTYHGTSGLLKTIKDANGNITTYGDADASDYGYSATGQAKIVKDAKGNVTKTVYGDRGEVLSVMDAKGNISTFTYDIFERPLASKLPKDISKNEYIEVPAPIYDGNDNILEKTMPNGAKYTYKYDDNDNVIEEISPKDAPTDPESKSTYQYDELGNLIKETEPKGNLTPDDSNDYTTTYAYDELNRLVSVTNSKGDKITYEYDSVGNQIKVTQPKGNLTPSNPDDYAVKTEYDKNDRPVKVTDQDGKFVETTYDLDGNILTEKDKDGNVTQNFYNEVGQLIEIRNPHDTGKIRTTRFKYDKNGNQTETETPKGTATATVNDFVHKVVYDELNQVKEVIFPNDPTSDNPRYAAVEKMIYSYDSLGNITSVSMPPSEGQTNRLVTTFEYFDDGEIKSATDPWNMKTTYTYDNMGQETQRVITGSDGSVTRNMSWSFYDDGKLKTMLDDGLQAAGSNADAIKKNFAYQYDVNGNLVTMTDTSSGATIDTYQTTYNDLNQVAQLDEVQGGQIKRSSKFQYDIHGNPTHQEHAGGILDMEYTGLSEAMTKLTKKKDANDTNPEIYTYAYTSSGEMSQETLPNGNTTTYDYFLDDSLKQMETKKSDGMIIQKHVLEYNENGNRIKDVYTGKDANNQAINNTFTYTYDPRDRLVQYDKAGDNPVIESYVLDANNNIVTKTNNGQVTAYTYDKNRLTSMVKDGKVSLYTYDPMGRVEKVTKENKVDEQFTYDQFDRTIEHNKLKPDGVTQTKTQYTYDTMDRTTSKTEKAGTTEAKTTNFNYLGMTNQMISEEVAGQITKSYTYSPWGDRLSMLKQDVNELSFYQYNTDVDVEMLTDENGNVKATYGYNPYGEDDTSMFTGVDKPDPFQPDKEAYNPYRYGGQRWDPNTQSYDLGFRDYFPSLGRFLTPDAYNDSVANKGIVLDPSNNNLYAYAAGNPLAFTDMDGHWSFSGWVKKNIVQPIKKAVKKATAVAKSVVKKTKQVISKTVNKVKKYVKQTYYRGKRWIQKTYKKTKQVIKNLYKKTTKYIKSKQKSSNRSKNKSKPKPSSSSKNKGSSPKKVSSRGSTVRQVASIASGFVPIASDLNDAAVAITGIDPISGEATPRWMGAAGLLFGGAGMYKALSKSSNAVQDVIRSCKCFTAGTVVKTSTGDKKIEEVKVGDKVLAKDDKTGKVAYKNVAWLFQKQVDKLYIIHVGREKIQTTNDHPFWIKGFGWVAAEDLKAGMMLEDVQGKLLQVDEVEVKKQKSTVYNFKVEDFHTYYVSNLHVWTHNECVLGGSWYQVRKTNSGGEVHHMPAKSVSGIPKPQNHSQGPAIWMTKEDHALTGSFRSSNAAKQYRTIQKRLVEAGDNLGAMMMDINDIRSKFGSKYDKAINEMMEYARKIGYID